MRGDDVLSAQGVADRLGVAEKTVRRWVESGRLPAQRNGRAFAIRLEDALELQRPSSTGRIRAEDLQRELDAKEAELRELRGRYAELAAHLAETKADLYDALIRAGRAEGLHELRTAA